MPNYGVEDFDFIHKRMLQLAPKNCYGYPGPEGKSPPGQHCYHCPEAKDGTCNKGCKSEWEKLGITD